MKKSAILPFLLIGLTFSFVVVFIVSQNPGLDRSSLEVHRWGNLARLDELKALLKGFEIKSLIDTSCEEARLIDQLDLPLEHYVGVDRRSDVVEAIRSSLGSAERTFLSGDITKDLLPKADLILCWDHLQKLTQAEIRATLLLLKKSGTKYLLLTHFPELLKNTKSKRGGYRPINWTLPPYKFPEPMIQISEQKERGEVKNLALWKIAELP
jgi:hypothetical protein